MTPEHRAKISIALKAYRQRPDAHDPNGRGATHHRWKGGVAPYTYRRIGIEAHGDRCLMCGAPHDLVHHVDHDRRNNTPENLAPLCWSCHMQHHHGERVAWQCAICGINLSLRPFEARARVVCSRQCKEATRGRNGTFQAIQPVGLPHHAEGQVIS